MYFRHKPLSQERRKQSVKKLYRSRTKKMIGGVIGGLSEILPFEADPTILRVCVAVIATVTCFLPLTLAYLVCWVIIPKEPLTK